MNGTFWLALCAAYAIGCLATGYYLVRSVAGRDIRLAGSGGTGARNVSRVLGRRAAAMTIMGDAGKGVLAVALASWITPDASVLPYAMLAATAGHIWPAQLGFRGGKGVATSLGALLAWRPVLAAVFVGVFLTAYCVSRKSVFSAMASYLLLPVAAAIDGRTVSEIFALAVLSAVISGLHRRAAALELGRRHTHGERG